MADDKDARATDDDQTALQRWVRATGLGSRVTDVESALKVAIEALYDAADDDSATGGPDLVRGIYPTAVTIGAEGAEDVAEERIAELARDVISSRSQADAFGPGDSAGINEAPRADS